MTRQLIGALFGAKTVFGLTLTNLWAIVIAASPHHNDERSPVAYPESRLSNGNEWLYARA